VQVPYRLGVICSDDSKCIDIRAVAVHTLASFMSRVLRAAAATDQQMMILNSCRQQLHRSNAVPVLMVTLAAPDARQLMHWLTLTGTGTSTAAGQLLYYPLIRLAILGTCVALSVGLPVNTVLCVLLIVELAAYVSLVVMI
jgi:hypothetical protein